MKEVEPKQTPPNLFSYATNEYSQDAFICWSLEWASPENLQNDPELHKYGVALINALFEKADRKAPKIECVKVFKQHKRIDAFCMVNGEYPIIIEDKTNIENHSGQLQRYLEIIKQDFPNCKDNILSIYFKTGDQSSYSGVVNNDYTPFLRADILAVLEKYNGKDSILCNFQTHIQGIENVVQSYQSKHIQKWHWKQWIGFYSELQKRLKDGDWDEVNPPGKQGFMGFYWFWQNGEGCRQYLQLQQDQLCFKIEVSSELEKDSQGISNMRGKWHKRIMEKANDMASSSELDIKISRPDHFGHGKTMTVCVFADDYRVANAKGVIDMDKTVKRLQQAENLLKSLDESNQ